MQGEILFLTACVKGRRVISLYFGNITPFGTLYPFGTPFWDTQHSVIIFARYYIEPQINIITPSLCQVAIVVYFDQRLGAAHSEHWSK